MFKLGVNINYIADRFQLIETGHAPLTKNMHRHGTLTAKTTQNNSILFERDQACRTLCKVRSKTLLKAEGGGGRGGTYVQPQKGIVSAWGIDLAHLGLK